jgi:L-fuconolactonase
MRIDSHQHFWQYNPVRDAWITDDMKVIQRNFSPNDLALVLKENNIDGCVSVQADQSEVETLFLLEYANRYDFIKGVVGWVDLLAENVRERLEYFSTFKKLKGFRHVVQGEPDDNFLLRKDFSRGIAALRDNEFAYDILIYPKQLKAAIEFVSQFSDQRFVVDHMAKPFIKEGRLDNWEKYMRALATFDNVYCKVSGMVTEADWKNWKVNDFNAYLDVVFESFGSQRIMYGSDWPVCLVAASYQQQLNIVEQYISRLSMHEQVAVVGGNAIQFYNLK